MFGRFPPASGRAFRSYLFVSCKQQTTRYLIISCKKQLPQINPKTKRITASIPNAAAQLNFQAESYSHFSQSHALTSSSEGITIFKEFSLLTNLSYNN